MTIQTEFDRIRQVRADLEERGTPVAVVEIEVIVVDGNRLARELETHLGAWPRLFVRFERTHFLLSDAQDHDAFTTPSRRVKRARYFATIASLSWPDSKGTTGIWCWVANWCTR